MRGKAHRALLAPSGAWRAILYGDPFSLLPSFAHEHMRRYRLLAVTAASSLLAAQGALAQETMVWRNYEPWPRAFSQDSAACSARARQETDGLVPSASGAEFDKCVRLSGWQPMRRLAHVEGDQCEAVAVTGIKGDSWLAPALREAFSRRFRPESAALVDARYEILVTPVGLLGGAVNGAPSRELPDVISGTFHRAANDLAQTLATLSTGATQRYRVTFRARCVSEFPVSHDALPEPVSAAVSPIYFEYQVEKIAIREPGSRKPIYPPALRAALVEGDVLAQFVVDTLGRAVPSTFKVLMSTHGEFATAVQQALPELRFLPAEKGGRKVRQLVQQPFAFAMER